MIAKAKAEGVLKVDIGSGITEIFENGWVKTDLPHFNITNESDWKYFFFQNSPHNLLAEHVLEHLTEEHAEIVISYAAKYMTSKGCFRIAVPDAFHEDDIYIQYVRPGGSGPGGDDHKSFWDHRMMTSLLEKYGFRIELLEYYDEHHQFHNKDFDYNNGHIIRSKTKGYKGEIANFSSLIIDAYLDKTL